MQTRICSPQRAMFNRLGGQAPLEWFSLSLSLSLNLFSRACVGVPPLLVPFPFLAFLLKPHSVGMVMSVLHFLYLVGPYSWNVGNVCFTFPLYVKALCMIYVYIYICLRVCG